MGDKWLADEVFLYEHYFSSFYLIKSQIWTPLKEEGVCQAAEVDVHGEPPLEGSQHARDLQYHQSRLRKYVEEYVVGACTSIA